jgi:hypothetical protein
LKAIRVGEIAQSIGAARSGRQTVIVDFPAGEIRERRRIFRQRLALPAPEQDQALAKLRRAVMTGVQDFPWNSYIVPGYIEGRHELFQKRFMFADGKPFHVFEHEHPSFQFGNDPHEVEHELVARVVQRSVSDQGEPLARRASEHAINLSIADICDFANPAAAESLDAMRDNGCVREIVLMRRTMHRIDFDGGSDIETRLFEAQAKAPRTGKKIDSNRPHMAFPYIPLIRLVF